MKGKLDMDLDNEELELLKVTKKKKADEIFESLGYKKIINRNIWIEYKKEFKLKGATHIIFSCLDQEVTVCEENSRGNAVNRDYFSMQELQAINKKCKELGWI